ncbi:unnamed protein product [Symbiodinium natans]|uniref:Uncharacterized protein n=1 Tax=Symbiodinium natans TaxID=878477 RepID=A0A812TQ16_9DINO|nr:unnamed protein product [Symbiodinium natans]
MDPADRVLQELQREVAQVEPLRHQVAVFQGDLSAYHLEVEALRAEVRALRDQIAPLQEAHVRASARLQPRLVRPAPAIESLTERVLHNQSCFQFLVVALQRTFPHVQWQSLHEVLRKARLEPGVKQSLDREAVVRRWLCVLLHDTSASSMGQMLAGSACDGAELVSETFEGKATSTLLKRVRCIGKYVHWASDNGCDAFPFSIEKIRSYLKDAISGNKKSAIRDFASSLNFCRFVLGFQVSDDVTSHPWFKGTMRFANIRLRDAHRSRTLTVKEVKHLEEALIGGHLDRFDRYALGVMLFQLYARARVSDLRNLFKVYLDITGAEGYIEAHTYEHKSRRITSGPSAVLILVAPIQGLASQPWGLAFVQAAKDVGFDFEKGFRGPMLPRFASDYTWSGDAVDAAETTRWLNGILKALMGEVLDGLTSHGLKATTLSWVTKANYGDRTILVLGHHSLGARGKTSEAYGRDVQAGPLRDLCACLKSIRVGVFLPDLTRSGMIREHAESPDEFPSGFASRPSLQPAFAPSFSVAGPANDTAPDEAAPSEGGASALSLDRAPGFQEGETEVAREAEEDAVFGGVSPDRVCESGSLESSSDSESSGSSSEPVDYDGFLRGFEVQAPRATIGVDLDLFQNPKTKSIHARARGATPDSKMLCGRPAKGFVPFSGRVHSKHWKCKQCTMAKPIRDTGSLLHHLDRRLERTFAASLATVYTVCRSTSVQVGLPDDALQRLLDQGVDTLAKLAFAPGHPGESPSDEKLKALVAPVAAPGGAGGAEPSLGTVAAVRRLVFEAQTLVVNETKCLVENKEEQPKELPPAERRDRLQKQAARLAGVDLSGVNECSHASYDLCLKLISDNCVSYLQPSKFTCRQAELRMDKPRKELDVAAPGSSSSVLLIKDRAAEQHCDVTHALDLFQALHRRALAMDLVGLSTYARVQEWNSFLMNHLQQPVLAGYRSPTVQQLLHADRAAWVRLSELTPAGVRRKATGELPLDSLWADLQKDPRVVFHLLPLPDSSGKHPAPAPPGVPAAVPAGLLPVEVLPARPDVPLSESAAHPGGSKQLTVFHALEVFAGSARLTVALRAVGLQDSCGVDHRIPRHCPCPMVKLDLTRDFDVQLLHDMIDNPFCLYVHFAPPCGTSSRARLIQESDHDPEPCRDDTFPDGLPGLPDRLAQRVAAANRLYGVTAAALKRAVLAGKLVSCENPLNSFMWQTTAWRQGTSGLSLRETVFDHCCYGGSRPKHTLWVHNVPAFDQLSLTCPGESASHKHLPWGRVSKFRYATSEETAYPLGLCKAVAALLLEELCQRGFQLPARSLSDEVRQQHRAAQVSLGSQPRGKKVAPMVAEFRDVVVVTSDHDFLPASAKLPAAVPVPPSASCDPPLPELPMGSRILRRVALGGGETPRSGPSSQPSSRNQGNPNCPVEQFASVCLQQKTILADDVTQLFQLLKSDRLARGAGLDDEFSWSTGAYAQDPNVPDLMGCELKFESNRTPSLLTGRARGVPPELQQTIDFLASEGMHTVGASRTEALRQWLGRAAELDEQERVYKETLPKHCARTLSKKRLLLFGEMIEAAGHNDPSLVADMSKGFALGGPIPYCPEFRAKRTAATMAVDDLRGSAQRMRKGILNSTKSSGDDVVDAETYRVTLDEVERGWLDGPLKESDLGASSLLTRRFGVVQNNKTRPIDNYLESGLNATSSSYDTITVHTADCIASGLARRLRADAKCRLHQLLLKSWDLHKAYKNLPLSLEALEDSFLCVYDPKGKCPRIFRQKVLPFGSRHSVHAFCRVSLGIWKVLVVLFLCHINVYFDDFVGVELAPLARLFDIGVCLVFRLLGWDVAEDKESVFDSCAKVLGLKFDLSESRLGRITLCNTESRRDEIFEALSDILSSGYLTQKDGERIRGRLQFAENQIAGKVAGTAYKQLSRFVQRGGGHLDECTRVALLRLRDRVNFSPPRVICANILTTMHLYVDASCEGDNVGLGGVLVNEVGSKMGFFSDRASEHVRRRMNPESGNPIFEYECLAILVGLRLWAPLIRSTNLVVFTDNEGALACMVAGISSNKYGEAIAQHVHVLCDELGLNIWFERVNTCSNVADAPSRGSKDPELGKEFTIDLDSLVDHAFESWGL